MRLPAVTKLWTRHPTSGDVAAPRHFHTGCVLGRHLYVFGGYDGVRWRLDAMAMNIGELAAVCPSFSYKLNCLALACGCGWLQTRTRGTR
jgi:hypothetical protein